jgi:hypothetical protein
MDKSDPIAVFETLLASLAEVATLIAANRWEELPGALGKIGPLHEKIQKYLTAGSETVSGDPEVAARVAILKKQAGDQITAQISAIETWKEEQLKRITISRNAVDQLARYHPTQSISYYIDRQE